MHAKKGIELSINFLVTVIIALAIFGFGIRFIYNLAGEATDMERMTTEQLDRSIGELLCESSERVCIGIDKKAIQKGDFDVFGIKIVNIENGRNFELDVHPTGFTKNNQQVAPIGLDKIHVKYNPSFFIERNGEKNAGVGVEVAKTADSGTYILDVRVNAVSNGVSSQYSGLQKIYVEVP